MYKSIPGCVVILFFLFASCSTILNRKTQRITFYTQRPSMVIHNKDTVHTTQNTAKLRIERKNEPARVDIVDNGSQKTIKLFPHISTAFWFNLYPSLGIGMLVDMWTPKIWAYPSKINVGYYDSTYYRNQFENFHGRNSPKLYFTNSPPHTKGEIDLHISSPFINFYDFVPQGKPRNIQPGIGGASLGLDYYHTNKQFLSLNIVKTDDAISSDDLVLDIKPVNFPSTIQKERSEYVSLSNNYRVNRLIIGYGITAARNTWRFGYFKLNVDSLQPQSKTYDDKTHFAFGFIVPVYFQFTQTFYTGFIYRPTIYRPGLPDKFKYEHLMSIDFAWKFSLKK